MRSSRLLRLGVGATVLFCAGCGSPSLSVPGNAHADSDCGDCPNSKLLQPQLGLEQVVHPVFASWALFPLGTEITHQQRDYEANGAARETKITLKLLEKSESKVVLEESKIKLDLSGKEIAESKAVNIPSALPKSAQGHEPFYPMEEPAGTYEVSGKSIAVFLARSKSFGQEGECQSEILVSSSIPGLVARRTTRDREGKIVSEIKLIRFTIG